MHCNVLIVDDSPILRAAIKKVVKLAGVDSDRIHEAGNGKEALELLETVWIDLVLLDLNMPVMDGEQFAIQLREREELGGVRVVIVSTETNRDRLDRIRALGISDSLRKPFEPEDLCRIITDTMGVSS